MTLPSQAILHRAARRYGVDPAALHLLRDGANVVYRYQDGEATRILRLTRADASQRDRMESEIYWTDYLAQNGVRVPAVIRSAAGQLVEVVSAPGLDTMVTVPRPSTMGASGATGEGDVQRPESYLVVVFAYVQGQHPEGALLTDDLLYQWGKTLGQIHRVGRDYCVLRANAMLDRPARPELRRPDWHELDAFDLLARIPAAETQARAQCRQMLDYLNTLPRDETGYGLIHADPEPWNFFVENGAVTFIDFEESCTCWYLFDLAVSILYAGIASTMGDAERDPNRGDKAEEENGDVENGDVENGNAENGDAVGAFARHAWPILYAGYASEHPLPSFWLAEMPTFLRWRVLQDYAFHVSHWEMDNLVDWQVQVLDWQRGIILENRPVLEVDWHRLG